MSRTRVIDSTLTIQGNGNTQPDEFVTQRVLKEIDVAAKDSYRLPVIEVFRTIEGEGNHIGTPRILVRLAGCAVGCSWCDTVHSWSIKKYPSMLIDELFSAIQELANGSVREISITGGEPMHYPNQICTLAGMLRGHGYRTSVETSGLIFNDFVFNTFDYVSMDIKTPSSKVPITKEYINRYVGLTAEHPGLQLKCVIANEDDLRWVGENLSALYLSDPRVRAPLILTPGVMNTGKSKADASLAEKLNAIVEMIVAWNKRYNIRVIVQQHALLSYR